MPSWKPLFFALLVVALIWVVISGVPKLIDALTEGGEKRPSSSTRPPTPPSTTSVSAPSRPEEKARRKRDEAHSSSQTPGRETRFPGYDTDEKDEQESAGDATSGEADSAEEAGTPEKNETESPDLTSTRTIPSDVRFSSYLRDAGVRTEADLQEYESKEALAEDVSGISSVRVKAVVEDLKEEGFNMDAIFGNSPGQ